MADGTGSKRRRLGRGLSALIESEKQTPPVRVDVGGLGRDGNDTPGDAPEVDASDISGPLESAGALAGGGGDEAGARAGGILEIPLGAIHPNKYQPRTHFERGPLEELAESIRRAGVMQPIVVRRGTGETYELIAGERRWRAAEIVGLATIPALVREVDDETAAEWALIENLQREDLNPVERARAMKRLADEFGLTQQEVADRVALSRASVTNLMRLLELDDDTLDLISEGSLTLGHGKALLTCQDKKERGRLAKKAVSEDWSVRTLERIISPPHDGASGSDGGKGKSGDASEGGGGGEDSLGAVVGDLERRLGEHLETRVEIRVAKSGTRGRVLLHFYDLDQFDGLLKKVGLPEE
ncbi:MAG: ParB/RepB/Spo0J family partition protein [Phycisphaerales bacterium JB040]